MFINFRHGFTQPACVDRQQLRRLCESGDITLEEWIPVRVTLRALVQEACTRRLMQ